MPMKNDVEAIIKAAAGDLKVAANQVMRRPKMVRYVVAVGLKYMADRLRRDTNRETRTVLSDPNAGSIVSGIIKLSKRQRARLERTVSNLFAEYMIGNKPLGEATREALLDEARAERAAAKGHSNNAYFYERLARRLKPGEKVPQKWTQQEVAQLMRDIWKEAA